MSDVWNTGWIFHWGGSFSFTVTGPIVSSILNGPWHFGASLIVEYVVVMFFPSSHTSSPLLYCGVVPLCRSVTSQFAILLLALISSLNFSSCLIHCSTVGLLVCCGWMSENLGLYPISMLNGDVLMVLCSRRLCANSANGSSNCQLSCWKLQKAQRYCSNSWFIRSVCPSVWGWYAMLRFWFTPSMRQSSLINLELNWGPLSDMIF